MARRKKGDLKSLRRFCAFLRGFIDLFFFFSLCIFISTFFYFHFYFLCLFLFLVFPFPFSSFHFPFSIPVCLFLFLVFPFPLSLPRLLSPFLPVCFLPWKEEMKGQTRMKRGNGIWERGKEEVEWKGLRPESLGFTGIY